MTTLKTYIFPGLEAAIGKHGPGIVIVDSVYSASGTLCQLEEAVAIAGKNNCAIIVDESHSLGLYGNEGCGLVGELGLTDKVDFITASLCKVGTLLFYNIWVVQGMVILKMSLKHF